MSYANNVKSFGINKIHPFDEHNFAMWKTKTMVVLETMDYEMVKIIKTGPHIPIFQPIVNNAPIGPMKQKPESSYDNDDKRLVNLDVRARAAIGNSLPYYIYHLCDNP